MVLQLPESSLHKELIKELGRMLQQEGYIIHYDKEIELENLVLKPDVYGEKGSEKVVGEVALNDLSLSYAKKEWEILKNYGMNRFIIVRQDYKPHPYKSFPLGESSIEYFKPSEGKPTKITSKLKFLGKRQHISFRADKKIVQMLIDIAKGQSIPVSEALRRAVEEYVSGFSTIPSMKQLNEQVQRHETAIAEMRKALVKKGIME